MENKVKPGYQTTEFWMTFVGLLVPFFVLFGVLTPEEGEALILTTVDAITAIGALLVSAAPILAYIKSRAQVKSANGSKADG